MASVQAALQRYFDSWNAHDASAIVSTFADGGTYADPTTGGRLSGDAIGRNAANLWTAFPDVQFEVKSHTASGADLFASEWVMTGTNTGPFAGLPPTGRRVTLDGADFIRADERGIHSVQGYFDAGAIPRQLGLQVVVQPEAVGPFTFGTSARVGGADSAKAPGAFSITSLQARSPEDIERVRSYSRDIAMEMLRLEGFMGWVGVTVGGRMLTISAWQGPDDPKQLMAGGRHGDAMRAFFGPDLAAGGWTSVWVPERINTSWSRCTQCGRMVRRTGAQCQCGCGADLGPAPAYW